MKTILTLNFSIEPFTIAYLNNYSKVQISQDQHTSFSERIDIILKEEFEKNAILLNDIDAIGIISGPGSYTGLRISMSYVKSLAQIYNIPLFTFNALEVALFNHTTNDAIYLSNFYLLIL